MPDSIDSAETQSDEDSNLPSVEQLAHLAAILYWNVPGDFYGDRPIDAVELAWVLWEESYKRRKRALMTPEQIAATARQQRQHYWYKDLIEPTDPTDQTTALGYLWAQNFNGYKTLPRLVEALEANDAAIIKDLRIGGIQAAHDKVSIQDFGPTD
jgi:hypothetical protein